MFIVQRQEHDHNRLAQNRKKINIYKINSNNNDSENSKCNNWWYQNYLIERVCSEWKTRTWKRVYTRTVSRALTHCWFARAPRLDKRGKIRGLSRFFIPIDWERACAIQCILLSFKMSFCRFYVYYVNVCVCRFFCFLFYSHLGWFCSVVSLC